MPVAIAEDPMLRYLPDPPNTFRVLDPAEQSFRGRIYLMTWVLSHDEAYSWDAALTTDAAFLQAMRDTLADSSDSFLEAAVQRTLIDLQPRDEHPETPQPVQ